MKPVKFVHLTDTHMNAPGKDGQFAKFQLADKVVQVFRHIEETGIAPAFVLITGDLSHEGDAEDYAHIRKLLDEGSERIGAPVHVVLGNHDHRGPFREGYLGEQPSEEPYYYSHTIDGLRLIGLNTQVPGSHNGNLDETQFSWLKQELQTSAPKGTVIGLHHPLLSIGGVLGDHILANREQVGQALSGTDVVAVLAGHVHSNNIGSYHGVLNVAAAGTAFAGEMADAEHFRMVDACSYNIVSVSPGEGVSIQTVALPTSGTEFFKFSFAALAAQH